MSMFKSILTSTVAAVSLAAPAMAQITSVSQLRDVQPTDWSYQALSNLISQYNCVAGYPNGTFKPGQPATRAELAALVDSCLSRISEYQSAEDARLAAALKEQAAQWKGTQAQVAAIQAGIDAKKQGVGNYLGAGVFLNKQGMQGAGKNSTATISGATIQGRYVVTRAFGGEISARPYMNFAAGPNGNIGAAGGLMASYDYSLAKTAAGVSKANVYGGVGYQIPFVNQTQSNTQAAIGASGQAVFALGLEGRLTNSLVGFTQLTFPTTTPGIQGAGYSPVLFGGLGLKF